MITNFEVEFELLIRTRSKINASVYEVAGGTRIPVERMRDILGSNDLHVTDDEYESIMDWIVRRTEESHERDRVQVSDDGSSFTWKVMP